MDLYFPENKYTMIYRLTSFNTNYRESYGAKVMPV